MDSVTDETTLVLTRLFSASPASVFDAWLNREEWQAWIGPEGVNCEVPLLEPHVGGRYRVIMRLSNGQVIPVSGILKVIERPSRLVFTWGWEGDALRESLITLVFNGMGPQTELVLHQEGLGSISSRNDHEKGWSGTLRKLERYLTSLQL